MKIIHNLWANINHKEFIRYCVFSVLFMIAIIVISSFKITQARYETNVTVDVAPTLAFFLVDVENQTGQIKLDSMVPRDEPYLYTFEVSNFNSTKHANVDLTYSIEIITTTNMHLNFRIFKGNNLTQNEIDSDTITTNADGVYYRHLVIDGASVMDYDDDVTDLYTLWVQFPLTYKNQPNEYAGVIDLVDIKINAEQVV